MATPNLERWHAFMARRDPDALGAMLHDDMVFTSPVVHIPPRGKALTIGYLMAATGVEGVRERGAAGRI